jgi:splicing factor 3B subunit 3
MDLHLLVPGGTDGPGGVLVCAENCIYYRKPNHSVVKINIPRRSSHSGSLLIISSAMHRTKDKFVIFVQSELGDIYRLAILFNQDTVKGMTIKYLDSFPPAVSLCMTRSGFLFAASEFGNHHFMQYQPGLELSFFSLKNYS